MIPSNRYRRRQSPNFSIIRILIGLLIFVFVGCASNSSDNGSSNESNNDSESNESYESDKIYFAFHSKCGAADVPDFLFVSLFDESNGDRLVSGNTLTITGTFISPLPLDRDGNYRLELFDSGNDNCVMWIRHLNFYNNPIWFWDHRPTHDEVSASGAIVIVPECYNSTTHYDDCWDN